MGFSSAPQNFVERYAPAAVLATVALFASAVFTIKAPPTGLPPTGTVNTFRLQNGSGAQVAACFDDGSCRFSGSIVAAGVTLSGGAGGSFGTGNVITIADARYVNQSGDTMTGTLKVRATISGTTLVIDRNGSFSGSLIVKNTVSGSVIHSFGLGDCDTAATSKLLWDFTTGKFKCGTDQTGGGASFTAKTSSYTAASGDFVTADVTGGSFDVTLPAAASNATVSLMLVKQNNTGSKTVSLKAPSGSAIILNNRVNTGGIIAYTGSIVLDSTGSTVGVQSNGTNWFIVNDGRPKHRGMLQASIAQTITGTEKVLLKSLKYNIGQIADPINSQFVIKRSGQYQINGFCSIASTGLGCEIYINGSLFFFKGQSDATNGEVMINAITTKWLNKGDRVELYQQNQVGGGASTKVDLGRNPFLTVEEL